MPHGGFAIIELFRHHFPGLFLARAPKLLQVLRADAGIQHHERIVGPYR